VPAPSGPAGGPSAPAAPSGTPPAATPATPAPVAANDNRPDLGTVLETYQVASEAKETWRPAVLGVELPDFAEDIARGIGEAVETADIFGTGEQGRALRELADRGFDEQFTPTEARALDELRPDQLATWFGITDTTGDTALERVGPVPAGQTFGEYINDGHVDAYRHALWNARMTREFGEDWTARYATGHEKAPDNPPAREAMDLYNNEVGRRIAVENPGASDADLQRLVGDAMANGELLVIDKDGNLKWSDQIAVGEHGQARPGELPGNPALEADETRSW
jgi:hypothetical protein